MPCVRANPDVIRQAVEWSYKESVRKAAKRYGVSATVVHKYKQLYEQEQLARLQPLEDCGEGDACVDDIQDVPVQRPQNAMFVLTHEEEKKLVDYAINMAEMNMA